MCAIVGSKSKATLKYLLEINAYRGQLSHSLAALDERSNIETLIRQPGSVPDTLIDNFPDTSYYIGHIQAPTTESRSIHPAAFDECYLWHNGIVKQKEIPAGTWDTEWILKGILADGFDFLSTVNGTFACVAYIDKKLYVFRNEISPLFVDDELNISSTKFDGSRSLDPNVVFEIDLHQMILVEETRFETKENPYFFA